MALRRGAHLGNGFRRRLLIASLDSSNVPYRDLGRTLASWQSDPFPRKSGTVRCLTSFRVPRHVSKLKSDENKSKDASKKQMSWFNVAKVTVDGDVSFMCSRASELLREAGSSIYARDLYSLALTRRQDGFSSSRGSFRRRPLSAILPRGSEILLSFGYIRAVIGTESAMLFDAQHHTVKQFVNEIAETFVSTYKEDESKTELILPEEEKPPFELVFIEEVLRCTCDAYNRRIHLYQPIVDSMLNRVSNEVFSDAGVHQLVPVKDSLQQFEMQVKQGLDCLTGLLESDEDMLGLLLREQQAAKQIGETVSHERHQGVELMLEDYLRQLSNIRFEIQYLLKRLQSKQEFVALALDGYRNRLIRMNAYLGIFGLGIGVGTTVAGFFGMNVISGYEQSTTAFGNVVMGTSVAAVLILVGCSSYISGRGMKQRAVERLNQIDTLHGALSDMSALDHVVKEMMQGGSPLTKDEFRDRLQSVRHSRTVTDEEVDLLFHSLDVSGDGVLFSEDFRPFNKLTNRATNDESSSSS